MLVEAADVAPDPDVLAHHVLGGGGDEEVLLLQAEGFALDMIVSGVEHLGDDLGHGALLHALDIVALGEEVHVQRIGALGVPQPQGVDLLAVVAGDQHVPGDGDDGVIAGVLGVVVAVVVPVGRDLPAEADLHRVLVAGDQPAFRGDLPVVGYLGLLPVLEALPENAQLVADGIARGFQAQGGHAVHIAGGQAAQTAVAQARVGLLFKNVGGIAAQVLQRAGDGLGNAQIEGVFHEAAAHQELHGHIVDFLFGVAGILHRQEAAHDLADDHGGGAKDLLVGSIGGSGGKIGAELVFNGAAHFVAGNLSDHRGKYLQRNESRKEIRFLRPWGRRWADWGCR